MSTLLRISYIDHRGFVVNEWKPTIFTADDRVKELDTLGMESVDVEEVEVPWDHLADLIHWLNTNPNSPPIKEGTMNDRTHLGDSFDLSHAPASLNAVAEAMYIERTAAAPIPVVLSLPDGDPREVKILWSEVLDGKHHLCINVSGPRVEELPPDPVSTAPALLSKAAIIMEERGKQYDKPDGERSMGKTVVAFNAITGHTLTESQGWLLLQLLKDVRLFQRPGYHQDSAEDCIAYSALKAEAKSQEA